MNGGCKLPPLHTGESPSVSYTHTHSCTLSYPPPCHRLHCTDEILMVLLGRIMNMLVSGVVYTMCVCACMWKSGWWVGGWAEGVSTLHTPTEACNMQQTCTRVCRHTAHQCVFLVRLFYTLPLTHTTILH